MNDADLTGKKKIENGTEGEWGGTNFLGSLALSFSFDRHDDHSMPHSEAAVWVWPRSVCPHAIHACAQGQ